MVKVIVKWKDRQREFAIDYNVGDVVKITNYGSRCASQRYTLNSTIFICHNDIPFNLEDEYLKMPYYRIPDLEWKIIDIGYTVPIASDKLFRQTLVIKLRDRQYHNMLFVYNPFEKNHNMKVVRTTRSYVEEYIININV